VGVELYKRIQANIHLVYRGTSKQINVNKRNGKGVEVADVIFIKQSDFIIDKYYNDLLQVLTEDDNLRVRKNDMMELAKTDVVDFNRILKLFETRMEEKVNKLKEQKD